MGRLRRDQAFWAELAELDAEWAVCSDSARLGRRWTADEFFASGVIEVDAIVEFLAGRGLRRSGRALDFGCGVGRLTRALSRHYDEVVGVDISSGMLARAVEYNQDLTNCRFVLNADKHLADTPNDRFDLVLSLIALQHVSDRAAILSYVSEFIRVLEPGGVAVFQVAESVPKRVRWHPLRLLTRLMGPRIVRRFHRLAPYAMALTPVSGAAVRDVVHQAGGRIEACSPDNRLGSRELRSMVYCVVKLALPPVDKPGSPLDDTRRGRALRTPATYT